MGAGGSGTHPGQCNASPGGVDDVLELGFGGIIPGWPAIRPLRSDLLDVPSKNAT